MLLYSQAGGPQIDLAYGRRDGLDSFAPAAGTNLPASTLQVGGLLQNFQNVGLNLTDVVVLSGKSTSSQISY
jgi:peroxidase